MDKLNIMMLEIYRKLNISAGSDFSGLKKKIVEPVTIKWIKIIKKKTIKLSEIKSISRIVNNFTIFGWVILNYYTLQNKYTFFVW